MTVSHHTTTIPYHTPHAAQHPSQILQLPYQTALAGSNTAKPTRNIAFNRQSNMFHRITLEAGKLKDARLVKLNSNRTHPSEADIDIDNDIARCPSTLQYDELSFAQEADIFFRSNKLPLSFLVYLLFGSIFYYYDYKRNSSIDGKANFVYGFYQVSWLTYYVMMAVGATTNVTYNVYVCFRQSLLDIPLVCLQKIQITCKADIIITMQLFISSG